MVALKQVPQERLIFPLPPSGKEMQVPATLSTSVDWVMAGAQLGPVNRVSR